ncbi:RHS domain-containing protein [Methylomonas sp. EFPC1]|uniref:RHS repeat-associated core domain-containing protein n=1 Tax=Methylomonas sp. EFPC1 TaxID=2812647 RepID=UPI001967F76C|nr:RHS repeat-associated core domain-containing protein [Methylomonas sp. EFPC1]QSB01008.1 RHS domain-containing protein [Methylomonas sp. EFPC1]
MAGWKDPRPTGSEIRPRNIDAGTTIRDATPRPTPIGVLPGQPAKAAPRIVPTRSGLPTLKPGSQGAEVRQLQGLLNACLSPSPNLVLDGRFAQATANAVRQYQQSVGINADGIVGKDTWFYLLKGDKAKVAAPMPPPPPATASTSAVQSAPAPNMPMPIPVETVGSWTLERKFSEALRLTAPKLPGSMRREFEALLSPESLAIMAATLVIWAGAHVFGVGEIVDILMLVGGILMFGLAVFGVARDLGEFLAITATAGNEQDLDEAATHLAEAIAVIGVAAFVALLAKVRSLRGKKGLARESGAASEAVTPSQATGKSASGKAPARAGAAAEGEAAGGAATSKQTACPGKDCKTAGEPISMLTGEEMLEKIDFTWDGPLPLAWRRYYRSSQSDVDHQLGFGWLTPLDEWLEIGERVTFCNADGQRIDLPLPKPGAHSINLPEQVRLYRENGQYRIVDPSGLARTFTGRSGRCPLRAWHNSQGQSLYFHRDANGDVERISASWNKHLLLERQGRRIVAIRPGKRVGSGFEAAGEPLVNYLYSEEGDLIGARDRLDQGESYAYRNHVIARRTLPTGFNFYFEWDQDTPQGKCLHNWGDNGVYDYRFEWLPDGVSHAIDSRGGVAVYHHDPQGLLLLERSPEGRETCHSYNADNQLAQTVAPDGGVTRFNYDNEGRLIGVSDALGFSQRVKYDKQGRPVELIDALDQRWLRRYDANGRLEETVAANGAVTQYQYNAQGVPVRITDALGRTRSLLWDEQLRLVGEIGFEGIKTRYQYDDDDRIVAIVDQDKRTTRYGYDAAGRVTAVQHADGSTVQLRYNAAGLLTHYIDGLSHTTEYRYDDGLSQPTARIDPLGHEMRYRYDSERNLIGLVNPKGETYSLNYDRDENLIEEIGFDGRIQRYRYNAAGALEAYLQPAADGDWSVTRFERDRLGRLLKKHAADGSLSQYGYDPLGRLQLAKNADSLVLLGYNALGQINQENQNGAIVRHKYDLLGRRIHTETPDRHRIDYRFGERYLDSIEFDGQTLTSHRYDDLGREIGRSQGPLNTDYDYDPLGRLLRQRVAGKGQAPLIGRQYSYDTAGKLRELDDLRQGRSQYHYDPAARLIRSEGLSPESFVHDPAGNLLGASAETGRVEGDRLLMMGDRHYSYDVAGNLIEEKRGKAGHSVTRYQYDSDNRLIRAETPNGTTQYRYDALGRRIAKHTAQGETRFQYDGPRLLTETDSQRSRTYLFEPGSFRPLALHEQNHTQANGATYHYHLDHLGTPRELTDTNGRIVWSARYHAYGNLALADVETIDNPLRFQGQYYDAETGLHYNLNRYYDPNAGRFIHQDPIGIKGGINIYCYLVNPIMSVDPLGLAPLTGVDFSGSPDLFPSGTGQQSIVEITMQGSRSRDFVQAYKAAGISPVDAEGYTWHHVDDFNPSTGKTTMQLVKTEAHEASFPHRGSVSQFEKQYGVEYDSKESVDIANKNGWLKGRKPKCG